MDQLGLEIDKKEDRIKHTDQGNRALKLSVKLHKEVTAKLAVR